MSTPVRRMAYVSGVSRGSAAVETAWSGDTHSLTIDLMRKEFR